MIIKKENNFILKTILAGVFVSTVGIITLFFSNINNNVNATINQKEELKNEIKAVNNIENINYVNFDFTNLVENTSKSVVSISVIGNKNINKLMPDKEFEELLKHFGFKIPDKLEKQIPQRGSGSGFIIREDGIIVTNAHVVDDANEIKIKLNDNIENIGGKEYTAKILGIDKESDLAILKIEEKNLPILRFADSDKVKVGEWVLAIGSPFGFDSSVSLGIISAKSRRLPGENYVNFIQTDAAINPGNSGGPLINKNGEVVGVNSQILSTTGGNHGLGFSISANTAKHVVNQLVENGIVTRGRIGVVIQMIDDELAKSFNLKNTYGALVSKVEKNSMAEKAGFQVGDIIIKINDKEIKKIEDVVNIISNTKIGNEIEIEIIRDGKNKILKTTVSAIKNESKKEIKNENFKNLNFSLRELNLIEKRRLNVENGLLVENSNNEKLKNNDIILKINNKDVFTIDDANRYFVENKINVLLILRENNNMFITIK